jgi:hypothetical protein
MQFKSVLFHNFAWLLINLEHSWIIPSTTDNNSNNKLYFDEDKYTFLPEKVFYQMALNKI